MLRAHIVQISLVLNGLSSRWTFLQSENCIGIIKINKISTLTGNEIHEYFS